MRNIFALMLASLLALPATAAEQPPPQHEAAPAAAADTGTTARWLQLQRSGTADGKPNALPGEAVELIYQRFLGSFGPGAAESPRRPE